MSGSECADRLYLMHYERIIDGVKVEREKITLHPTAQQNADPHRQGIIWAVGQRHRWPSKVNKRRRIDVDVGAELLSMVNRHSYHAIGEHGSICLQIMELWKQNGRMCHFVCDLLCLE